MRLGTRWPAGEEPPNSVPASIRIGITQVESQAGTDGYWTLTWLEGRPVAELDTGWEVFLDAADDVVTRRF
jgi:hypothetical protein